MTIATALRAWKRRRLKAQQTHHLLAAEHWRAEARRLALLAYEVPDMMVEPLKWGRLQNGANWAKHHERKHRDEAQRIERLIGRAS